VTAGDGLAWWSRRRVLALGLGSAAAVAAAAGAAGLELVDHRVLPGKSVLDQYDGACQVASPALEYSPLGPSLQGTFYSAARNRKVGYAIAYPPGRGSGDELPLVGSAARVWRQRRAGCPRVAPCAGAGLPGPGSMTA
jgi:hypothetical protein